MKVTIIAGGPSLEGFDFNTIQGPIIAVNHSYLHLPRFDILCVFDWKLAVILAQNPEIKPKLHTLVNYPFECGGKWINEGITLTNNPAQILNSSSTAVFALNVAYRLGFTDITLLGCDNKIERGGKQHFYDDIWCPKDVYEREVVGNTRDVIDPAYKTFAHFFRISRQEIPKSVKITAVESELTKKSFGIDTGLDAMTMEEYKQSLLTLV
jgi:hypothetical protein